MKTLLPRLCLLFTLLAPFASTVLATSITGGGEVIESEAPKDPGFAKPTGTPQKSVPPANLPTAEELAAGRSNSAPAPAPAAANTPAQPAATPPPITDEFVLAMQSAAVDFRERRFDEALKKVQKAEALKPGNSDVMNFRGAIFAETGQFEDARALYEKAIQIEPASFWPYFNLYEVEFMQRNYSEARKGFEKTMIKFPDNELLRFKIVLTYLQEENREAAKAELERFRFPSDTAAYYYAWAAWEFSQGNIQQGNDWIASGERVFGRERTDFVYQSLADLKWVPLPRP